MRREERIEHGEVVLGERQRVTIHRWLEASSHKGPVSFTHCDDEAVRVRLLSHRLGVIDEIIFALDGTMIDEQDDESE